MKIGVIGVIGGWSSETLADKFEKKTGTRILVDLGEIYFDSEKSSVFYKNLDLMALDALVVKKAGSFYSPDLLERLEILSYLEEKGLTIFSLPNAIKQCVDRLSCTLILQAGGIPIPPTVITESIDKALDTVKRFGKVVFKPLYTSKARGMEVYTSDDEDLKEKIEDYKNSGNKVLYIQKFLNLPGQDLGMAFLGGKYIATYARVAGKNSWNTTTRSGGKYEPFEPDENLIEIAHKAQSLFGLDFTSVDIVETEDGPMVFEVSAFGGFRGLKSAHGIDAAELYASYVIEKLETL
ncbi:MAG: GAK system ATP-grasp enzyme [Candidatus Zixiibacteriota bacterium]